VIPFSSSSKRLAAIDASVADPLQRQGKRGTIQNIGGVRSTFLAGNDCARNDDHDGGKFERVFETIATTSDGKDINYKADIGSALHTTSVRRRGGIVYVVRVE
jgi:hypothetical protein